MFGRAAVVRLAVAMGFATIAVVDRLFAVRGRRYSRRGCYSTRAGLIVANGDNGLPELALQGALRSTGRRLRGERSVSLLARCGADLLDDPLDAFPAAPLCHLGFADLDRFSLLDTEFLELIGDDAPHHLADEEHAVVGRGKQ